MREVMEVHRADPLCASCHNRMDPLGLALENYNALGMYRTEEKKQPIDASGKLVTGRTFKDARELKVILKTERKLDFYRCLTEKLMTYALGRGIEYHDVESVDRVVERIECGGGPILGPPDGDHRVEPRSRSGARRRRTSPRSPPRHRPRPIPPHPRGSNP